MHGLIESNNLKNRKAIFQAGLVRQRVEHAILFKLGDYTRERGGEVHLQDETLIRRMSEGSRRALDQAVERFTPYVSAAAWRVLAPSAAAREDLEEVVSDVFLALWTHAAEIDPARLRAWLGTVARNKAVDRLRTLSPALPLREDDPDGAPGPEDQALMRDQARRLYAAVEAMEEPDRTLFLRHYYEGEKLRDAAQALGLSTSAAKIRLCRGRKRLKQQLMEGENGI